MDSKFSLILLLICVTVHSRGSYYEYVPNYWATPPTTTTTTTTPSPRWTYDTASAAYRTSSSTPYVYRTSNYNPYRKSWTSEPSTPSPSKASWRTYQTYSTMTDSSLPIVYWEPRCRFPRETCGIENQAMMGANFEPGFAYIDNRYEKVMILDSMRTDSSAARLVTPYIKTRNWDQICLSMEYLIQDEGIEKLTVIQQDRQETRPIYHIQGEDRKGKWRIAKMDIVLREGIVRFFLEARVRSVRKGVVMIRSLDYEVGTCKYPIDKYN